MTVLNGETQPLTRIPAASRKQAMDWSLVLLSQGIASVIDEGGAELGWGLLVEPGEVDAAKETLRQYQRENRGWRWRRHVVRPGVLFDWASLAWVLLAVLFYVADQHRGLREGGEMLGTAVARGEWWRLFTAEWLHADLGHLAANLSFGFILLGLVMGRYGGAMGLLAACLAGAGGNVTRWFLGAGNIPSVGASGMVMGALGLVAVQAGPFWRNTPLPRRKMLAGVLTGAMLFVLFGLDPRTDVLVHAGGFVSGIAIGAMLLSIRGLTGNSLAKAGAGVCFTVAVALPWFCALRHY